MILLPRAVRVYFATQPTNLRKSVRAAPENQNGRTGGSAPTRFGGRALGERASDAVEETGHGGLRGVVLGSTVVSSPRAPEHEPGSDRRT